jgi:hypothetical protein
MDIKLPAVYDKLTGQTRWKVREQYVKLQDGLCFHCKCPLTGDPDPAVHAKKVKPHLYPDGFFKHPVHLHHSHVTGLTLGAVHNHCNAVLWEYHGE